ncbi:hypothetical protein QE152_g27609 [Popillia japonica]|uniref:Uncharacterized protein n=1 Tax=Popillia japonica TaxID=7064 RepID=A0AAW1JVI8_POPJA
MRRHEEGGSPLGAQAYHRRRDAVSSCNPDAQCNGRNQRALLMAMLLFLTVVGLTAGSPYSTNTRPQPDHQPIPEDYNRNRPYDGVDFGPMGPSSSSTDSSSSTSSSGARSKDDEPKKPQRIQVASVSFQRVKTPFIIGLWIFCASLAKIGKL